jgi:hypothetical protein
MEQLSPPPGQILMKFEIDRFFENLSRRLMFRYNRTSIKGILHEKQCKFFYHISLISSYNEKCIRQKAVQKIETHNLCSAIVFENLAVYEIKWKNIVEQGWPLITIRFMHTAGWIPKATNTHIEFV